MQFRIAFFSSSPKKLAFSIYPRLALKPYLNAVYENLQFLLMVVPKLECTTLLSCRKLGCTLLNLYINKTKHRKLNFLIFMTLKVISRL